MWVELGCFSGQLPWDDREKLMDCAGELAAKRAILKAVSGLESDNAIIAYLLGQENALDCLYSAYLTMVPTMQRQVEEVLLYYDIDPTRIFRNLEQLNKWERPDYNRNISRRLVTVSHNGFVCLTLTRQKPTPFKELAEALGVTDSRLNELLNEGALHAGTRVTRLQDKSGILIGFPFQKDAQEVANYIMLRLGILKSYQLLCGWMMLGYSEETAFCLADAIYAVGEKRPPAHGKFEEGTFHVAMRLEEFNNEVSFRCPQCGSP